MSQKIKLLIIDPQKDFILPDAPLYVNNAEISIMNLVHFINVLGSKFDDINVTIDSHHQMHIAHPLFWINQKGEHPGIYTVITKEDVQKGIWKSLIPTLRDWSLHYVQKLEENNRYQLTIWPYHCLIGTPGFTIYDPLMNSLLEWERKYKAIVNKITKGSNIKTEHYSIVKADVSDPEDNGTLLNTKLIANLEEADIVFACGYASSHCLKFTMEDIADNFGTDNLKKIYLLTDCMDPVKGYENQAEDFLNNMKAKGANLVTTTEILRGGI